MLISIAEILTSRVDKLKSSSMHDFRLSYLKLNRQEVIDVAHQPKDMIQECIFTKRIRNQDPLCENLMRTGGTKIFTPTYGVCYMYNFRGLSKMAYPMISFYPGEEYGLQLTLNVESKYISY